MKKTIALILVLAMCLTMFAACGNDNTPSMPDTNTPSNDSSTSADSGDDKADWVKMELTYASFVPDGNTINWHMQLIQEKLTREYPEYFSFTNHYGGTLLGFNDMLDGLENGIADICLVEPSFFATRLPVVQMFYYPGVTFNSGAVATRVFNEVMTSKTPSELDGFKYLLGYCSGPSMILTKDKVETLDDLKGLQLRATATYGLFTEALGAVPVGLTGPEIYEALRSGMVDGAVSYAHVHAQYNLQEVANNGLILPMMSAPGILLMNEDSFNKMPASQQEAFMECVNWVYENFTIGFMDERLPEDLAANFLKGLDSVVWADQAMIDECYALTSSMTDEYIAQLTEQGIDAQGYWDLIKELADKYNAEDSYENHQQLYADVMEGKIPQTPASLDDQIAKLFS